MTLIRSTIVLLVIVSGTAFTMPASGDATPSTEFLCPATEPVDERPDAGINLFPNDASLFYEDGLWVTLPEHGVLELASEDTITFGTLKGWRSTTVTWLREEGVDGFVEVTGTRLDADSDLGPQTPLSPQRQYVRLGPVTTGLAFPSGGCWEVTGSVGDHSVTFVVDVRFAQEPAATPQTLPRSNELPLKDDI